MLVQDAIFLVLQANAEKGMFAADAVVGHSLGEYAALVAAGSMTFRDAIGAVAQRGRLMKLAGEDRPGAMVAVLGLELTKVESLCARLVEQTPDAIVQVANINGPGQIIISGDRAAFQNVTDYAKELGAKAVFNLPVTIAGHSELMRSIAKDMEQVIDSISLAFPVIPFYSPTTGLRVTEPREIKALLVAQLTSRVEWVDTILSMKRDGYRSFHEVGPGKVLSRLVHDIDSSVEVSATNS